MKLLIHFQTSTVAPFYIDFTPHYNGFNYLSMLGLKLINKGKRGHDRQYEDQITVPIFTRLALGVLILIIPVRWVIAICANELSLSVSSCMSMSASVVIYLIGNVAEIFFSDSE